MVWSGSVEYSVNDVVWSVKESSFVVDSITDEVGSARLCRISDCLC